jgi:hypothetical protein
MSIPSRLRICSNVRRRSSGSGGGLRRAPVGSGRVWPIAIRRARPLAKRSEASAARSIDLRASRTAVREYVGAAIATRCPLEAKSSEVREMNSVISCDSSHGLGQTWMMERPSSRGAVNRISPASRPAAGIERRPSSREGQAFFELPFFLALAAGFFLAFTTLPLAAPRLAGLSVMKSSVI